MHVHYNIVDSSRIFWEMFKEYLKAPSPMYYHSNTMGNVTTVDNFSIVGKGVKNLTRTMEESVYIRVNNRSLNKNIGKYHLPQVWHEVLFCSTPQNSN